MMQFDKFLSHIFLLIPLLDNATSPWGQSWERVLHKRKCIQITVGQNNFEKQNTRIPKS